MPTLVTGAAGFIGSHVAEALLTAGEHVVGLDDLSGGFESNLPSGIDFHAGSILDGALVARLFRQHRFDFVFHLAAYAAEGLSHFIRRFNYSNNVVGSMNIINEAIKARTRCLVFTSSIAVYGHGDPPFHEEGPTRPADPYGIAKQAVEQDLHAAHDQFGLNSIIFRPHNVFGERQHLGDRYRNVIGIFMNQILSGREMTVFGDGTQTRGFTYIGDVVPVLVRSVGTVAAYNRTFNIGADTAITVNELAKEVAAAMGVAAKVRHLPARNEVQCALADHTRLIEFFGYHPQWTLQAGLRRMAQWAYHVGARPPTVFQDIELTEGLPAHWNAP